MVLWGISGPDCGEHDTSRLLRTPWSVRVSRQSAARVTGGQRHAVAWGRLGSAAGTSVRFFRRSLGGGGYAAEAVPINDWFWVATADGRFAAVTIAYLGTSTRRRIAGVPPL